MISCSDFLKLVVRSTILIVVPLAVSSCITTQRYPSQWESDLQNDNEDINIAGTYENVGENANGERSKLALLLFPTWEIVYNKSITHVAIDQQTNNIIKVAVWSNHKLIKERTYNKLNNDFQFESGHLIIKQPAYRSLSKFLLGTSWGEIRLARNKKGELLIQNKKTHVGLFLVIPIIEFERTWYRFFESKSDIGSNSAQED